MLTMRLYIRQRALLPPRARYDLRLQSNKKSEQVRGAGVKSAQYCTSFPDALLHAGSGVAAARATRGHALTSRAPKVYADTAPCPRHHMSYISGACLRLTSLRAPRSPTRRRCCLLPRMYRPFHVTPPLHGALCSTACRCRDPAEMTVSPR